MFEKLIFLGKVINYFKNVFMIFNFIDYSSDIIISYILELTNCLIFTVKCESFIVKFKLYSLLFLNLFGDEKCLFVFYVKIYI